MIMKLFTDIVLREFLVTYAAACFINSPKISCFHFLTGKYWAQPLMLTFICLQGGQGGCWRAKLLVAYHSSAQGLPWRVSSDELFFRSHKFYCGAQHILVQISLFNKYLSLLMHMYVCG